MASAGSSSKVNFNKFQKEYVKRNPYKNGEKEEEAVLGRFYRTRTVFVFIILLYTVYLFVYMYSATYMYTIFATSM
jgi:hypothetical protein